MIQLFPFSTCVKTKELWTKYCKKVCFASRYLRVLIFNNKPVRRVKIMGENKLCGNVRSHSHERTAQHSKAQHEHIKGIFLIYCNFWFLTIEHMPFVSLLFTPLSQLQVFCFYVCVANNTFLVRPIYFIRSFFLRMKIFINFQWN